MSIFYVQRLQFFPGWGGMWLFGEGEFIREAIFFHVGNAYLEREQKINVSYFFLNHSSRFSKDHGHHIQLSHMYTLNLCYLTQIKLYTYIIYILEPQTTIFVWLFQSDDSKPLHSKWWELTKPPLKIDCLEFQDYMCKEESWLVLIKSMHHENLQGSGQLGG